MNDKHDIGQGTGTIGDAYEALVSGLRVCRSGWHGKGMWIQAQFPDENSKMTRPYNYIRTPDGALTPWTCSQADFYASDWCIAQEE